MDLETYRKTRNDEAERYINAVGPTCNSCVHFHSAKEASPSCAAFPKGVPADIWDGTRSHHTEYPGDGGIRFTSRKL